MVDGNRTFFLTGGAGFIGSHLTEAILAGGDRVLAIDNLATGSMDNVTHFLGHPNHRFEQASITDRAVMEQMASEADVIVHLAAAVGVKLIVEHPVQTIETNVMGTEEVLRVALGNKCRVLIASTSEVYGKGSKFPFAEEDDVLLGATSKSRWGYAASKMVDEFLGLAYWREFGLDVVPFRLFNTIGPRQTGQYGMVVPRFIRQALGGEPVTVYGDGKQRRCFCDVRDVVTAILGLAGHPDAPGRVYNIGGTEEVSIQELAERVVEMTESDSQITKVPYSEAYAPGFEDMERRVPDTGRVHELLGWKPKRGLREILSDVISYERGRIS
jgi:UDP-glucose 4-epimerase